MRPECCPTAVPFAGVAFITFITLSAGDIKRGIVSSGSEKLSVSQLGPAVFKQYQEVVSELMRQGTPRIVVDGLDPQYWRGQVQSSACWVTCVLGSITSLSIPVLFA